MNFSAFPASTLRKGVHRQRTIEQTKENSGITKFFLKDLIKESLLENDDISEGNKTKNTKNKFNEHDKHQSFNVSYTWETDAISGLKFVNVLNKQDKKKLGFQCIYCRDKQLFKKKSSVLYHMVTFNHGLKLSIVEDLKFNERNSYERLNFINNLNVEKGIESVGMKIIENERKEETEISKNNFNDYKVIKLEIEFVSTLNLLTYEELVSLYLYFFPEKLFSINEHVNKESIIENFLLSINLISKKYSKTIKDAYSQSVITKDAKYISVNEYLKELKYSLEVDKDLECEDELANEITNNDVNIENQNSEHVVNANKENKKDVEINNSNDSINEDPKTDQINELEKEGESIQNEINEQTEKIKNKLETEILDSKNRILININDYNIFKHNDKLFINLSEHNKTNDNENGDDRNKCLMINTEENNKPDENRDQLNRSSKLSEIVSFMDTNNYEQNIRIDETQKNMLSILLNTTKKTRKYTKVNKNNMTNMRKKARINENKINLTNLKLKEQINQGYFNKETLLLALLEERMEQGNNRSVIDKSEGKQIVDTIEHKEDEKNVATRDLSQNIVNLIKGNSNNENKDIYSKNQNDNIEYNNKNICIGATNDSNSSLIVSDMKIVDNDNNKYSISYDKENIENISIEKPVCTDKGNSDVIVRSNTSKIDQNIDNTTELEKQHTREDGEIKEIKSTCNNLDNTSIHGEIQNVMIHTEKNVAVENEKNKCNNNANNIKTRRTKNRNSICTNNVYKIKKTYKINNKQKLKQIKIKQSFDKKKKNSKNDYCEIIVDDNKGAAINKNKAKAKVEVDENIKTFVKNNKRVYKSDKKNINAPIGNMCIKKSKKRKPENLSTFLKKEVKELCGLSNDNIIKHENINFLSARSHRLSRYIKK
ncbi:conserved Plasmodium protein, unknown function [Plasmodium berghei]|uniref:Uncharacterized protein n=2 Tax=Plasmodium berghei TaxID=5821 RepID=A0A509AV92_PLABA|nr:conserved Plasmodium protein, unknown function [Plasmodium berghei ANKA]CXJ24344.1 conserved Plasmodium protein, unknown function [Plasmodium berghei]SCM26787.1 conserved Plasmodium protein, unknown function [Plasmodium berghei]SCN28637.1 conserved Plasmodium protein, unknown function [Plasmodium berghei]SCO62843.1 conserved Plasmodium protein, unknown function [Plasmodium berghei]SCO64385.1 conserved Plasmodium protein, unknown function [Plasmodium berghei]|eukprot:XP_034424281.1 conserved Plasmodium protein, unknown function [Plasmodium berghei ANKA]